jgi:hypothetical protein
MILLVLEREMLCCVILFPLYYFIGSVVGCVLILIARREPLFFRSLMDSRTTPHLTWALQYYGLAHCEEQLKALGVHYFDDLNNLTEPDFLEFGITKVDARDLFASVAHWSSSDRTLSAAPSLDTNMMAELISRVQQKDVEAVQALQDCLYMAYAENETKCIGSIRHALTRLMEFEEYTRNAMLSFTATTRGRAQCRSSALRKTFDKAMKAVRDDCVWRVQMSVPWGDYDAFVFELNRANGTPMKQAMLAQFLHSHSKTVSEDFPSAFLSKTKLRRRLPRRARSRDRVAEVGRSSNELSGEHDTYPGGGSQPSDGEGGNYPGGLDSSAGWLDYIWNSWPAH